MLAIYSSAAFSTAAGVAVSAGAYIEVRREDTGAIATIWQDEAGTVPQANGGVAFAADPKGRFAFYAAGLARGYRVKVTDPVTAETHTVRNQAIGTAAQRDASQYIGDSIFPAADAAAARTALGVLSATSALRKNALINGGFTVNQRAYVSAAVLAAGSYGHDRWKAGASGGDYSFTQLAHNTQITIAAGKSLIQVVEDKNVVGGSYILSWSGTAQARAGVNSATPSGTYAASPLVITGQTAGTVMSVEFNAGTLSKVQLEVGSVATEFEQRTFQDEKSLCGWYYREFGGSSSLETFAAGTAASTTDGNFAFHFPEMRAAPTLSVSAATDFRMATATASVKCVTLTATGIGTQTLELVGTAGAWATAGNGALLRADTTTAARIKLSAEL